MGSRLLLLTAAAVAMFGIACSDDDDDEGGVDEVPAAGTSGQSLQITAIDFAFEPDEFSARGGESTEVVVQNAGDAQHTFTIDDLGIDETIAPGEEVSVTFDAPQEGTEFYCRFHSQMRGTLAIGGDEEPSIEGSATNGARETDDDNGGDDDDDDDGDNSGSGSDNSGSDDSDSGGGGNIGY